MVRIGMGRKAVFAANSRLLAKKATQRTARGHAVTARRELCRTSQSGWPAAWVAQQNMRHKSSKTEFRAVYWFTIVLHCSALAWVVLGRTWLQCRSHRA